MQKRTTLRPKSRRKVSPTIQDSGLIAKAAKPQQSVGTKSALDNRSHRTERQKKTSMMFLVFPFVSVQARLCP